MSIFCLCFFASSSFGLLFTVLLQKERSWKVCTICFSCEFNRIVIRDLVIVVRTAGEINCNSERLFFHLYFHILLLLFFLTFSVYHFHRINQKEKKERFEEIVVLLLVPKVGTNVGNSGSFWCSASRSYERRDHAKV